MTKSNDQFDLSNSSIISMRTMSKHERPPKFLRAATQVDACRYGTDATWIQRWVWLERQLPPSSQSIILPTLKILLQAGNFSVSEVEDEHIHHAMPALKIRSTAQGGWGAAQRQERKIPQSMYSTIVHASVSPAAGQPSVMMQWLLGRAKSRVDVPSGTHNPAFLNPAIRWERSCSGESAAVTSHVVGFPVCLW